jgi:hypothetical protein
LISIIPVFPIYSVKADFNLMVQIALSEESCAFCLVRVFWPALPQAAE